MAPCRLLASILSANITRLGAEVETVLEAGVDGVHIDVMDNHYVPNLSFGPLVCEALRQHAPNSFLDVHLMAEPVDALIAHFAAAGASAISFHPEASHHIDRSLALIRDKGCQAGLALNPATPLDWLEQVWHRLDFVLMMSVNPGFAGQSFLPQSLRKLQAARALIVQHGALCRLAVDGGVKLDNIAEIARAGADTFVIGSALFGQPDYRAVIQRLRAALSRA